MVCHPSALLRRIINILSCREKFIPLRKLFENSRVNMLKRFNVVKRLHIAIKITVNAITTNLICEGAICAIINGGYQGVARFVVFNGRLGRRAP